MTAVLFVTTEFEPLVPGGAGAVVADLAGRLVQSGGRAIVVLVTPDHVGPPPPGAGVVVVGPDDPDEEAPTPFLAASRTAARETARIVREGGIDRIELQDFHGLAYWPLVRRRDLGLDTVPMTVRMHGPIDLIYAAMGSMPAELQAVREMERGAYAMADAVLVPSEAMSDVVGERYGVEPERVVVAEPPVPVVRPVGRRPVAPPEFAVVGRLGEVKGSHDFVAAALELLDRGVEARFRFIGPDGWSVTASLPMSEWLRSMVPVGRAGAFAFEGPADRNRLGEVLATATAVVLPSRFESFNLVAHEVRALGVPLVVPDLPAFRPFFDEAHGALIYDGSIEELVGVLRRLALDPGLAGRLAAAPPPVHRDPLEAYRSKLPPVRHPRVQAGLATAAWKRVAAVLDADRPPPPPPEPLGRVGAVVDRVLHSLPEPVASAVERRMPDRVSDKLRSVNRWMYERSQTAPEREFRAALRRGDFPELDDPLVTVVVPCFNQGAFVESALRTVFAQSLRSWEVVVVDDGSTDPATRVVLDGLDLPRVRVVRQENRGLPAARNAGMRRGRGRYLVPLDADDELTPTFLEELTGLLAVHPRAAVAHCWAELFGDQSAVWVSRPYNPYQLLISNSLVGCVVMRAAAWREVGGYDEAMRLGNEDWDLWVRFLEAGWEQVEVPRPLFRYRRHGVTMSVETEARYEQARLEVAAAHTSLYEPDALRALKRGWYPWVSVLVEAGQPVEDLAGQTLDDVEVVSLGPPTGALRRLCDERGWPLRAAPPSMAGGVATAHGKLLVDWRTVSTAAPDALARLARALEDEPDAYAAAPSGEPLRGPTMWRRWALLDPGASPDRLIRIGVEVEGGGTNDLRGGFPDPRWALPDAVASLHPPSLGALVPVVRERPEIEGEIPAWLG